MVQEMSSTLYLAAWGSFFTNTRESEEPCFDIMIHASPIVKVIAATKTDKYC